jgi:hypothetical protein
MPSHLHILKSSALRHFANKYMARILAEKETNQILTRFADCVLDESFWDVSVEGSDLLKHDVLVRILRFRVV